MKEVAAVLREMAAKDASEIDVAVASQDLERCFAALRRETGFKRVQPGEPVPLLSYELVQAQDSVESAMKALAAGDLADALGRCRSALFDVQRVLQRWQRTVLFIIPCSASSSMYG